MKERRARSFFPIIIRVFRLFAVDFHYSPTYLPMIAASFFFVSAGIAAGAVCYLAVTLKNQLGWDDALDVWGIHGVGGFLGIVLLGVFASTLWNPNGADGLLRGNPAFLGKQFVAAVVCSAWAFSFTYAMLWLINLVTPVKVDEVAAELARSLDRFTVPGPDKDAVLGAFAAHKDEVTEGYRVAV